MTLTDTEKQGLRHFFQMQEDPTLVYQLAKTLTKNVATIDSDDEAFSIIFLHSYNISTLLNKRIITKELLFKYLHQNKVSVATDFTKVSLINQILDYWKCLNFENSTQTVSRIGVHTGTAGNETDRTIIESSYPIHLLARQFSDWFFTNYNNSLIKIEDFWADARLDLRIIANDGVSDQESITNKCVLETLEQIKQKFDFFYNPNITHEGVQGRIDIHGLVLVLSCGTLHTLDRCVGLFESTFGLMRDPFSENNWKIKTIQLLLRSRDLVTSHSLEKSESIQQYLTLPAPPDIAE